MAIMETIRKMAKAEEGPSPEKVETPGRIEAIVNEIIRERKRLEVAMEDHSQIFSSSGIINKGSFKGRPCLIIDTLIPKLEGIHALEGLPKLEIGFCLGEVPHTFESGFFALSAESSPLVTISYPRIIWAHQFRDAFRVPPALAQPITVKVTFLSSGERPEGNGETKPDTDSGKNGENQEIKAIVEDISITGMGLLTRNGNLAAGTEIHMNLEIPGIGCFEKKAVVMNSRRSGNSKFPFKCGIEFKNMSKTEKDRIYQYIVKLQRQELKRQKGL
jgi:c-di-GMP-binding flagellar brake protein YcgR